MNKKRLPISCFMIAKNEADRIGRTIECVRDWVDEIVVVDSGSTDQTKEIVTANGGRFLFNPWQGYGPQKRFAEQQCRNDWVLNLDADEILSAALQEEIQALFSHGQPSKPCYSIYLINVYPNKDQPRLFADYHNYVRLYDRTKSRFRKSPVHDTVDTGDNPVEQLKSPAYHHSILTLSHLIEKNNHYTDLQAEAQDRSSLIGLKLRLLFEFPVCFLKYYFLRRHFTGGLQGIVYSFTGAAFRFFRIAKRIEKRTRRD